MIHCGKWPLGVCTWSLKNDPESLAALSDKTGLDRVHLSLEPVLTENHGSYLDFFLRNNWKLSATMIAFEQEDYSTLESIRATGGIVPDRAWSANRDKIFRAVDLTADLPTSLLEFHFGFIPPPSSGDYPGFKDKVQQLADYAARKHVTLLMETGQETAEELLAFLQDLRHPALAVNFDPANMILYNKGNPADALKILAAYIRHVHAKDALCSDTPGTWGTEVPWAQGQVQAGAFLQTLDAVGFQGPVSVEREAGSDRMNDITHALNHLRTFEP